jgi:hypothetical protein
LAGIFLERGGIKLDQGSQVLTVEQDLRIQFFATVTGMPFATDTGLELCAK